MKPIDWRGAGPEPDPLPPSANLDWSSDGALSEDELDGVVGGLMRTWATDAGTLMPRVNPDLHPRI